MLSDNEHRPVRAIYSKMLLHRNMLPLLVALLLVGCEQEEQQPQNGAAEHAGQAVTPPIEQPAESSQKPAAQTPDEVTPEPSVSSEEPQAPEPAREPAPEPMPILVKAGGVQQLPTAEEAAAAEREKYAAPTDGSTPLLQNLYGGAEVQLPASLYSQLESELAKLRSVLSPMDYALLLGQVKDWWENGRNSDEDGVPKTVPAFQKQLAKIAEEPENLSLFARPLLRMDKRPGTMFRPLARYANGQMHYADERVLVSLNNQNRYTASDIGEAEPTAPLINHFWDARTEQLLLRTEHRAEYLMPLRVQGDSYALCQWHYGFGRGESLMKVQSREILPFDDEAKSAIPDPESEDTQTMYPGPEREKKLTEASAADGLGIAIQTMNNEGETGISPLHFIRIKETLGRGEELRYRTCWGDATLLNLRTLTLTRVPAESLKSQPLPESVERQLAAKSEGEYDVEYLRDTARLQHYPSAAAGQDYSSNEETLRAALNWPLTFAAKVKIGEETNTVVLSEWHVGTGSTETIAYAASARNCYEKGYTELAHGRSEYMGVWHKGQAWIFAAPEGAERLKTWQEDELFGFHSALKGKGRLLPLDEVARQATRGRDIISWDDHELLVTEPGGTDECTYLLIGGTKTLHRLRVNFTAQEVEYLESWPVKGAELGTVWLDELRLLLLPESDNEYRLLRPSAEGTTEEIGSLYLTESDGYAVVLKDGRYAGSPGCEAFLDACDGRQVLNMRALAPWRNRPAEVLEVLGGNEEDVAALRATTQRWLRKLGYDADAMPAEPELGAFPVAEVTLPELFTNEETLNLPVRLRATAHDISRLQVLRDGVTVPQPQVGESEADGEREVTVQVPLAPGQNWLEVTPVDAEGIAGETTRFRIIRKGGFEPNMFVVALGVADYDDDSLDLQYAAKDARDMAKAWADCSGMQTRTLVLTDKEVRDSSVLEKIKAFLSAATLSDKIVFYVAGHGMLDSNLDYYYAPAGFDTERVAESGISADALMDCLDSAAAQSKLLLMDTCHAGELGEAGEEKMALAMEQLPHGVRAIQHRGMKVRKAAMSYAARKRYIEEMFSIGSTRRGINMLAASAGAEYALETSDVQNGLFTASIIEALREPAWRDCDYNGILSIEELFTAVQESVVKQTGGVQKPSISMLENRGLNEIAYHPGYYIQCGEWDRAVAMLRNGVRLLDTGKVRRPLVDSTGTGKYEQLENISWLQKALCCKATVETIEELLNAGLSGDMLISICSSETMEVYAGQSSTRYGHTREERLKLLEVFIRHGVEANKLMFCRPFYEDENVIKLLLQQGADINARDEQGKTPLMQVASPAAARVLLNLGADATACDNEGKSVLENMAYDSAVCEVIRQYANGSDETAGLSAAQVRELGVDYAEARNGKTKDESRAIQLYIKAADMGDMKARRWMGWRYRQGRGVPKDEARARTYFSAAAR